MTSIGQIGALAATIGTVAAASLTWAALAQNPSTNAGKAAAPGPGAGTLIVCVAQDSVLRAVSSTVCPTGQTQLSLASGGPNSSNSPPPSRELDLALADLERRIAQLKQAPLFTVVDKNDQPIFSVASDRALVYRPNPGTVSTVKKSAPSERVFFDRTEAASISFLAGGGVFTARSDDGRLTASIGSSRSTKGIRITEDGAPRLELGTSQIGRYSLRVPSRNGQGVAAGIGETEAGTGAVIIGGESGQPRARMLVYADGKGALDVLNGQVQPVAALTEGATGGGLLLIGDSKGAPMVKMGVKDDRYGIVMAGPKSGFPLVPRSGLPGSYFLGCAGGSACQP
jgi:hypothetical protein